MKKPVWRLELQKAFPRQRGIMVGVHDRQPVSSLIKVLELTGRRRFAPASRRFLPFCAVRLATGAKEVRAGAWMTNKLDLSLCQANSGTTAIRSILSLDKLSGD